jgi:hypothetical protein
MSNLLESPELRRELPGIVTAFDHKAMSRHFEATLFGDGSAYVLRDCEVDQATFLPPAGCIVRYELSLRDRRSKSKRKMFVTGRGLSRRAELHALFGGQVSAGRKRGARGAGGPGGAGCRAGEPAHGRLRLSHRSRAPGAARRN